MSQLPCSRAFNEAEPKCAKKVHSLHSPAWQPELVQRLSGKGLGVVHAPYQSRTAATLSAFRLGCAAKRCHLCFLDVLGARAACNSIYVADLLYVGSCFVCRCMNVQLSCSCSFCYMMSGLQWYLALVSRSTTPLFLRGGSPMGTGFVT